MEFAEMEPSLKKSYNNYKQAKVQNYERTEINNKVI